MKKFFLLTKTLLVMALLCVGASNAWGDNAVVKAWDFVAISDAQDSELNLWDGGFADKTYTTIGSYSCDNLSGTLAGLTVRDSGNWQLHKNNGQSVYSYHGLYQNASGGRILGVLGLKAGDIVTITGAGLPESATNGTYDSEHSTDGKKIYTVISDGNFGVDVTRGNLITKLTITRDVACLWDFTDNSTWNTAKFSSEATYSPYGISAELGAAGINFNLSGKVTISSNGMSFNSDASASLTDNIPTSNYIKVSVPAGYKAAVEYYGYNKTRHLAFTFNGVKTTGAAVLYTKKEFDNSEGETAVDLYIYAAGVNRDGHAKLYSINLVNMSSATHKWTASAKANIGGVSTEIDTWNSVSGNYTTTIHEGENYYVPAKRVITYGGKFYELNDANYSGKYLYKTYNMGNSDVNHDITYTEASDIVYYSEIEDAASKQHMVNNKASGGKYVKYMTTKTISDAFSAGEYTAEINLFDRKVSDGSNTTFYLYDGTADESHRIVSFDSASQNEGIQEKTFDLASSTTLIYGNPSNSAACDYILIRKVSEPKTITSAGWATYCSPYPLDLANATGLTDAFIVTGGADGVLTKTSVKSGTVPANTGLLLKGDEGTATIPVVASSETNVSANKLIGKTAEYELAADGGYVLMNDATYGLAFYMNENAFTVGANTAYLPANFTGGTARSAYFFDSITNVANVEAATGAAEKDGKFVINGQLVIKKNGKMFNANGAQMK